MREEKFAVEMDRGCEELAGTTSTFVVLGGDSGESCNLEFREAGEA